MLKRGLEAINFLAGSTLAKELVAVFQDCIDFRDNLKYSHFKDNEVRKERIDSVYSYLQRTTLPNFQKVVLKETGLKITEVICTGTQGLTGFFAVSLAFDDEAMAETMINMQTGKDYKPKSFREELKEMMTMGDKFDLSTGKIDSYKYGKENKREIRCIMYMDAMMAFLLHDFLPINTCVPLTAEELAAIYTHEIGHVLTTVERANNTYMTITRTVEHLMTSLKNTEPREALKDFNELGVPFITNLMKESDVDSTAANLVLKAIQTSTYILEEEDSSWGWGILELVGSMYMTMLKSYVIFATGLYLNIFIISVMNGLQREFSWVLDKGKTSDLAKTHHNLYQMERLADEFVSRHGLGSQQISALNKMDVIFPIMTTSAFGSVTSVFLRKSSLYGALLKYVAFLYKMTGMFSIDPVIYEDGGKRAERLFQNSHAVFKNRVPDKALAGYVYEYDALKRLVVADRGNVLKRIGTTFLDYIREYTNPATLLAMILTGRLTKDFDNHQNKIENLINNELYSISGKLKFMARK